MSNLTVINVLVIIHMTNYCPSVREDQNHMARTCVHGNAEVHATKPPPPPPRKKI